MSNCPQPARGQRASVTSVMPVLRFCRTCFIRENSGELRLTLRLVQQPRSMKSMALSTSKAHRRSTAPPGRVALVTITMSRRFAP